MNRPVLFAAALASGLSAFACGELFDARVKGIVTNANDTASTGTSSNGNTTTSTGNANTTTSTTGNSNTATAGGNTAASNTNTTSAGSTNSNSTTGTSTGDTSLAVAAGCTIKAATYAADASSVIAAKCLNGCHDSSNTPTLKTYAQAKSGFSSGGGADAVANGSMPQGSTLTSAQKCALLNWVGNNYAQ